MPNKTTKKQSKSPSKQSTQKSTNKAKDDKAGNKGKEKKPSSKIANNKDVDVKLKKISTHAQVAIDNLFQSAMKGSLEKIEYKVSETIENCIESSILPLRQDAMENSKIVTSLEKSLLEKLDSKLEPIQKSQREISCLNIVLQTKLNEVESDTSKFGKVAQENSQTVSSLEKLLFEEFNSRLEPIQKSQKEISSMNNVLMTKLDEAKSDLSKSINELSSHINYDKLSIELNEIKKLQSSEEQAVTSLLNQIQLMISSKIEKENKYHTILKWLVPSVVLLQVTIIILEIISL